MTDRRDGPPIIGLLGGIGAGKSHVARAFAAAGCLVIDSDELAAEALRDPSVLDELRAALEMIVDPATVARVVTHHGVDRAAMARLVFDNAAARRAVESVVHPAVAYARELRMAGAGHAPAIVWDTPLLLESGLIGRCDATVFVDTDRAVRLKRVHDRGWDEVELDRREAAQASLDDKRARASHVVTGDGSGDLAADVAGVLADLGVRPSDREPEPDPEPGTGEKTS